MTVTRKVLEWFVDKESGIKTSAFLGALSVIFMFWFLGTLWRHMSKAEVAALESR